MTRGGILGYGDDVMLCSGRVPIKEFLAEPDEVLRKAAVRLYSGENVHLAAL